MKTTFNDNPEIQRGVVVSTAHITEHDNLNLGGWTSGPSADFGYGYRIDVGPFLALRNGKGKFPPFSSALLKLVQKAQDANFDVLILDCDGTVYDDLPTYEW